MLHLFVRFVANVWTYVTWSDLIKEFNQNPSSGLAWTAKALNFNEAKLLFSVVKIQMYLHIIYLTFKTSRIYFVPLFTLYFTVVLKCFINKVIKEQFSQEGIFSESAAVHHSLPAY